MNLDGVKPGSTLIVCRGPHMGSLRYEVTKVGRHYVDAICRRADGDWRASFRISDGREKGCIFTIRFAELIAEAVESKDDER